ncbi:unnamed protein product [Pieris macdunnoughi]|uniref:C3H1-type domain-containing protein n=1 Tax=Pieris macdunnoughi TaxID=345717 RepID=A0A821LYB1_9NEOP|nr:unnamed protein product [Pieris macdunnoughi]
MATMVNMNSLLNGKDSRWLQLEVCREFQRNKCSRPDNECKFAHPPTTVEVQNGRVTACYDSIKTRKFSKVSQAHIFLSLLLREMRKRSSRNSFIYRRNVWSSHMSTHTSIVQKSRAASDNPPFTYLLREDTLLTSRFARYEKQSLEWCTRSEKADKLDLLYYALIAI